MISEAHLYLVTETPALWIAFSLRPTPRRRRPKRVLYMTICETITTAKAA